MLIVFAGCRQSSEEIILEQKQIQKVNIDKAVPLYGLVFFNKINDSYFVVNTLGRKIYRLNPKYQLEYSFGGSGKGPDEFEEKISSISYDSVNKNYIIGSYQNLIWVYNSDLNFQKKLYLNLDSTKSSPNLPSTRSFLFDNGTIITGVYFYGKSVKDSIPVASIFSSSGVLQKVISIKDGGDIYIDKGPYFFGGSETTFVRENGENLLISFMTNNVFVKYDLSNNSYSIIKNLSKDIYHKPYWKDPNSYSYLMVGSNNVIPYQKYIIYIENSKRNSNYIRFYVYEDDKIVRIAKWDKRKYVLGDSPYSFSCNIIGDDLYFWDRSSSIDGIFKIDMSLLVDNL